MESFDTVYNRAAERKGGSDRLEALLGPHSPPVDLSTLDDSRFLSEFSKKVFQSGFVWRVVEQKWPGFETVFWQFNPQKLVLMPPEMLEEKAQDKRIIRNFKKVQSIIHNATFIKLVSEKEGGFGKFIAQWPTDDIVGLWLWLKQNGTRLGGNTGPYALRSLGKDTFLLSSDVEGYFRQQQLIDGGLHSQRSLATIQGTFNAWQQDSGRSLKDLSRILALSFGENRIV